MKKRILFMVCTLASVFMAGATVCRVAGDSCTPIRDNEGKNISYTQIHHSPATATDANIVEVKVVVNMNLDEYRFDPYFSLLAISEVGYSSLDEFSSNPAKTKFTGTLYMYEGVCDIITSFMHVNTDYSDGYDHLAWIILEDVEITDGDTIEINPSDAVNHIDFESINPSGEKTEIRSYRYIDEDYHAEVVDEGNVTMVTLVNTLTSAKYGMINYLCRGASMCEPTEVVPYRTDGEAYMDVYVNNVSDNYEFRQVRLMNTEENDIYVVAMNSFGSPEGELVVNNSVSDFFVVDDTYAPSWLDDVTLEEYEMKYTIYFGATETNGSISDGTSVGHSHYDEPFGTIYACSGVEGDELPLAFISMERKVTNLDTYDEYYDSTPCLYLVDAQNSCYAAFENSAYAIAKEGTYGMWYPGHPGLSVTTGEMNGLMATAPVIKMGYSEDYSKKNDRDLMNFFYDISSQSLETRGLDHTNTTFSIQYNGEEVLDGEDLQWGWPYTWVAEPHDPGHYLLTIEDNAFSYDNMPVRTVAQMSFDNNNADYFAPVLQGFQVRSVDGKLSHSFNNLSDGELRIVGADFNFEKSEPYSDGYYDWWYTMADAQIEVEYAVHGTDDFKSFNEMIAVEDTYWGFGQYWVVPLTGIDNAMEKTWYDVRVTLSDDSKNYQSHLFSPAFYINTTTAIGSIESAEVNTYVSDNQLVVVGMDEPQVTVYSVGGQLVMSGNGNILSLDALAQGIYVAKVTDGTNVEVVKIVKK